MKQPQFFADAPDFINLGHRGGCSLGPENTLEAALCGFRAGAHGWELDVGLSKDGIPMLLHDDSLERTTDASQKWPGRSTWALGEFRHDELIKLDAGFWWRDGTGGSAYPGCRMPTLAQALEFTREHGKLVNVEIKDHAGLPGHSQVCGLVVEKIQRADMVPYTLISSFQHEYLPQVRSLEPLLATAALVDDLPADPQALLAGLEADALHPKWHAQDIERLSDLAHEGVRVLSWTVNRLDDMRACRHAGIRGIISDSPDLFGKSKA